MKKIIQILKNNPAYLAMLKGKGQIVVSQASDEAILIASSFLVSPKTMLIVKDSQYQAQLLYQELCPLLRNKVLYFPSDESLRIEALAYSKELMGERVNTLASLCEDTPYVVICHTHSLSRYVPSKALFQSHILYLQVGMTIEPAVLRERLIQNGYQMIQRVDEPFFYSKRGGVIDVYSIQYDNPIRIEFFDDEIESIRFYDKNTQRSLEKIQEVKILPATDMLYDVEEVKHVIDEIDNLHEQMPSDEYSDVLDEEISIDKESLKGFDYSSRLYQYLGLFTSSVSLLEYMNNPLIITASYQKVKQTMQRYIEETFFYAHELQGIGKMLKGLSLYTDIQFIIDKYHIDFKDFTEKESDISFLTRHIELSLLNENQLLQQIKDYLVQNKILMCLDNQHQIQLMVELLDNHHIPYTMVGNDEHIYEGVNIYLGQLKTGITIL